MVLIKRIALSATALFLSFAVHTANYFFYTDGRIDGEGAEEFVDNVASVNAGTLEYLFPYVPNENSSGSSEPVYDEVPDNMTFSPYEFSKFKGTYLEETDDAGDTYFDDIVFCGDSLTYGLGLDERFFKKQDVVAWGGLGVYDYLDYNSYAVYNQSEEKKSSLEWLIHLNPKTMYIMLGTNGVAIWSNEKHIMFYENMLDRIQQALPATTIVLVGIPAWGASRNTETFNGKKVDNFNMMLLQLAKDKGAYYLNFGQATRDANGNIREDLVLGDGVHWQNSCKYLYLDYIKTHAIPQK